MDSDQATIAAALTGISFALANFAATWVLGAEILARRAQIVPRFALKFVILVAGAIVCLGMSPGNAVIALITYLMTMLAVAIRMARRANHDDTPKS